MTTWRQLSLDCYRDARRLLCEGAWRSSVSRAYYSAYSAVVERVQHLAPFGGGRMNPSHGQLWKLVDQIKALDGLDRKKLPKYLKRLFELRTTADYLPGEVVDQQVAKDALRHCADVLEILKVEP